MHPDPLSSDEYGIYLNVTFRKVLSSFMNSDRISYVSGSDIYVYVTYPNGCCVRFSQCLCIQIRYLLMYTVPSLTRRSERYTE